MSIISPVTGKANTTLLHNLAVSKIIDLYKKELEIDVTKFFNGLTDISVRKCLDTGYLFYHPFTIFGDEDFYNSLKIKLPELYNAPYYSSWKWEYEVSKQFLSRSDRIYEIGAGNGYFLKHLYENGYRNVSGSELNHESVNEGRKNGLDMEYLTIEDKARNEENAFDAVCCFQVLEHITDIKPFLESTIKILKPGGTLIIAVPYNAPFLFRNDKWNTLNLPPHHMGLWGKNAFMNLPRYFNVELNKIIIEKLPGGGYDFERFYEINKNTVLPETLPLKALRHRLYKLWLRYFHSNYPGKNILTVLKKV